MEEIKDELLDDFEIEEDESFEEVEVQNELTSTQEEQNNTEKDGEITAIDEDDIEEDGDIVEEDYATIEEEKEVEQVSTEIEEILEGTENDEEDNVPLEEVQSSVQPSSMADAFSNLEIEDFEDEEELSYADKIELERKQSGEADPKKIITFEKDDKLGGEKIDRELVIITDRPTEGLINYFRESGINANAIFTSLDKARAKLMIQTEPCRIVVMDTGLGKFTSISERKVLIDILGICDESFKISVFYCDSALKSDTLRSSEVKGKGKAKKIIDWHKYISTVDVVKKLLNSSETYIDGKSRQEDDECSLTIDDLMNLKPEETAEALLKSNSFELEGVNIDELSTKTASPEITQIPAYKIKL